MLNSKSFADRLIAEKFDFFTGVPCSLLSGLISDLESRPGVNYIPAVREDAAVGLCAGAYMAGSLPVLLMQNSGLGYSLNAFTSLNLIYNIPVLVVMSWRGFGGKDAPEHIIMGDINEPLLETSGMPHAVLEPGDEAGAEAAFQQALDTIRNKKIPFTLLVKKGLYNEGHH
ncbi:MAG: sulfopyruvate decarboxylase subunit alpha [Nitrospina sp.]|nr:sulfopyruvate decarboxylase subunit alpha [Nitrospina sp.]